MRSPQPQRQRGWSPRREEPQFLHVALGTGVVLFTFFLLAQSVRQLLAEAITQLLSLSLIEVEKTLSFEPVLVLKIMDGSEQSLVLTWQRSGFFSIIIFGLLFVFLVFPLKGSIGFKIAWLEIGIFTGLIWSLVRLSTLAYLAYNFGTGAFTLADFVTNPLIDFLWVIPVWSLGLSHVVSAKRKNDGIKGDLS